MISNKIINWVVYIVSSIIGGMLLIIISELINFSNLNLLPLGGNSWAVWFHALAFGISFGLLTKFFKIHKPIIVSASVFIFFIIVLEIMYNGLLFENPTPFGIGLN